MKKIKELCVNSRTYFKMIKLYNNFDMPIVERNRLIKTDLKEQEKFIEFLVSHL